MIVLNRQQVIKALGNILKDSGAAGVNSRSQLYKPPFNFSPDSLEAFLRSDSFFNTFGFMLHVTDLDKPPTLGGLIDAILKKYNPQALQGLSSFASNLLEETRPAKFKTAAVKRKGL